MDFEELLNAISTQLHAITRKLDSRFTTFNDEDLYQEAVLNLWKKYQTGQLNHKNKSYILRGCFLFLKNYIRKTWKKIDSHSICLYDLKNEGQKLLEENIELDTFNSYRNDIEGHSLIENIQRYLTPKERLIFFLRVKGFTIREVGKKLRISHVAVIKTETKIKNKYKHLRKELIF
jgi:RNA polymerase sigma factor (sigma-70 family)